MLQRGELQAVAAGHVDHLRLERLLPRHGRHRRGERWLSEVTRGLVTGAEKDEILVPEI